MSGKRLGKRLLVDSPAANPFAASFGAVPAALVGRDHLFSALGTGLSAGPRNERYTSLIMGVRGSGKTAILNELKARAANDQWATLAVDASGGGLLARIRGELAQAVEEHRWLRDEDFDVRTSTRRSKGGRLGPLSGETEAAFVSTIAATGASTDAATDAEAGIRHILRAAGARAKDKGRGILITVDELHDVDLAEGRRLANDLQHVTKGEQLPVAFVGAGLPELRSTLLAGTKITFFQRCWQHDLPPLTFADAYAGLRNPMRSAGGTATEEAMEIMAGAVDGSPYRLQAVGATAWTLAGAPDSEIDASAARAAAGQAAKMVDAVISTPAFYDLSEPEQSFLRAVAEIGDAATIAAVADATGMCRSAAEAADRSLRVSLYIERSGDGTRRLTGLVPAEVVLRETSDDRPSGASGLSGASGPAGASSREPQPGRQRCHKWMPRARARCRRPRGHNGPCRST